ncbi:hypothetical protein ACLBX9_06340 [Methylobacterium sp. A49B]
MMTVEFCEKWLSDFWESANKSNLKIPFYLAAHLRLTLQAVRCMYRLPPLQASLSDGPEGIAIRESLERICLAKLFRLGKTGACVLSIPPISSEYSLGSSKQTLRRKVRSALKSGVTCREVTDLKQQKYLSELVNRAERNNCSQFHRNDRADCVALVGFGLWTAAFDDNGEPLTVAITPTDGEFALLQKFISLGKAQQHSDARYILHQAVVERLSNHKVRYLVDTRSPAELPNGLRHFQRMLGFRISRIHLSRASSVYSRSRATRAVRLATLASHSAKFTTSCGLLYANTMTAVL